ncbi:amidohydrolase [soil metagenome]
MVHLTGAQIWTGTGSVISEGTVTVHTGRIVAVTAEPPPSGTSASDVVELAGHTIVPGFQDAHCHPTHGGMRQLDCDLDRAGGRRACIEAVGAYASANPDEPWISGGGWRMPYFPGGTPRREDLDAVVADRPVFLINADGHGAWVNSRALEVADITAGTPDPVDGRIERDADGSPTGTLHEGAMELVRRHMPLPDHDRAVAALRVGQAHLHALGITAWTDAWVTPEDLHAYHALSDAGALTGKVTAALWWERHRGLEQIDDLVASRAATRGDHLTASTVKIMADGVVENGTAAMLAPYLNLSGETTENHGLRYLDPTVLSYAVVALDRLDFQVHVHAIGDAAVRDALDAFEAARRAGGTGTRHTIAHLQVVQPDDLPRFAELGVIANAQPYWAQLEAQMTELTLPVLGPERSDLQYPWAGLLASGATLAFGSDWPVSTADPLWGLEVAVNRADPEHRDAEPFLPAQRLRLDDALAAATRTSAVVQGLDDSTGVLAPGMAADLAVLDGPLFGAGGRAPADLQVELTMVDGDLVHRA